MFSLAHYEAVANAFLRGAARCPRRQKIASVASIFVSRIDTMIDPCETGFTAERLEQKKPPFVGRL